MGKYDLKVMDVKFDGRIVGQLIRPRTARRAAEEIWEASKIRKLFYDAINSTGNQFRVPVFKDEK